MSDEQGKSPVFVAGLDYFKNYNKVFDMCLVCINAGAYDKWLDNLELYFHITRPYMKEDHKKQLDLLFAKAKQQVTNQIVFSQKREPSSLTLLKTLKPCISDIQLKLFEYAQPVLNKFGGSTDGDFNEDDFLEQIS